MIWCYVVVYSKSHFWRTCKPNLKLNINLLFEAHAKNDNWNHLNYLNPNVFFQSKLYTKYNAVKISHLTIAVFQEQYHHESLWWVRFWKLLRSKIIEMWSHIKPSTLLNQFLYIICMKKVLILFINTFKKRFLLLIMAILLKLIL